MKKSLFLIIMTVFAFAVTVQANAASCNVKAVNDPEDGAIFYSKDHRLHSFVELDKAIGDKIFCSVEEAKDAGFDHAPNYFSDSTARLVECVKDGVGKCTSYVIGQARSLEIYDKACAGDASQNEIVSSFLKHAQTSQNRMDGAKFNGTTSALMDAFPCGGTSKIARK